MKYRFDDLESLKDKDGMMASIKEAVEAFIGRHPVLQARAQAVQVARLNAHVMSEEEKSQYCSLPQVQVCMETEFLNRNKIPYLLNTERGLKVQEYFKQVFPAEDGKEAHMCSEAWAYMRLHLRVSPSQMIGWLNEKFETPEELQAFVKYGTGHIWKLDRSGWFVTQAPISKEESEDLDLFQSSMPMVCPPKKLSWGKRSPYLRRKIDSWTKKASVRHMEMPYEALNLQNTTPYGINYPVWEKFKFSISLPTREENEADGHYSERCKSKVREHWRKAFLYEFFWKLGIETIWVININDHRARNYSSQGGFIKLQGEDLDKSIPTLHPEILTERGKYWLSISIANCYNCSYKGKDLDKHIFEIRKEWYDLTIQPLMSLPREEFNRKIDELLPGAESPCCFWAQVQNMYEAELRISQGEEPMVWVITHWDATCSGYQFQAIMTKDAETGKLVNMHQEEARYDLYTERAKEFEEAGCTLEFTRTQYKKVILLPFMYGGMGWFYDLIAAGEDANAEIIRKSILKHKAADAVVFTSKMDWRIGDYYSMWLPDGTLVAKAFDHTQNIEVECLGKKVSIGIKCAGRGINPETGKRYGSAEYLTVIVHSCDGFVLRELLYRAGMSQARLKEFKNAIEHPDEDCVTPNRDTWEYYKIKALMNKYKMYSHRFLYILNRRNSFLYTKEDMEVIKTMLSECSTESYDISCIHDSFGVIPNHVDHLMGSYRRVMADLAVSRWLQETSSQLTHGKYVFEERKCPKEFYENILNSKYMLC